MMLDRIAQWPRPLKRAVLMASDALGLTVAVWLAYSVRLGEPFVPVGKQWLLLFAAPLIALPVFAGLGLYRQVIRFLAEHALWTILRAVSLATLLWVSVAFITEMTGYSGMPRSVTGLYWAFALLFVAGSRFGARALFWAPVNRRFRGGQVLIYGAGGAGRQLANALRVTAEVFPAGFLDDDPALHGRDMGGLRIYPPHRLTELIDDLGIREVLVAMPSVNISRRREILHFLEGFPVAVRVLPAFADLATGRAGTGLLRQVEIADLLGRDPVPPQADLLERCITDKVVLVTGAGGSIGSELCRQIVAQRPRRIILYDMSEFALYEIDRHLRATTQCPVVSLLGSVLDGPHLRAVLRRYGVQTVYHTAAYKHVPMVEDNPLEGVRNNTLGTRTAAEAAMSAGVESFVLVSTDKAVRPTSIMGASKRLAEMVLQALHKEGMGNTRFCIVRFGNVLGSSGSVIPLFREQIAQGGPVTVTHPETSRYFMSTEEAAQLVIQAGSLAEGGEIFLLHMGTPVRIADLAHKMIDLSGRTVKSLSNPRGDIEVRYIGLRPGEKLHEELLIAGEVSGTRHPRIMRAVEPTLAWSELRKGLDSVERLININRADQLRRLVYQLIGRDTPLANHREVAILKFPQRES